MKSIVLALALVGILGCTKKNEITPDQPKTWEEALERAHPKTPAQRVINNAVRDSYPRLLYCYNYAVKKKKLSEGTRISMQISFLAAIDGMFYNAYVMNPVEDHLPLIPCVMEAFNRISYKVPKDPKGLPAKEQMWLYFGPDSPGYNIK